MCGGLNPQTSGNGSLLTRGQQEHVHDGVLEPDDDECTDGEPEREYFACGVEIGEQTNGSTIYIKG